MKKIILTILFVCLLPGCGQKKETFSLDCDFQRQIAVEGESPYTLTLNQKRDFIASKYGVNQYDCSIWTKEKIECENSTPDGSFKMTYNRVTGDYRETSSDLIEGKKRSFVDVGSCKVISARTANEMMQAPASAPPLEAASPQPLPTSTPVDGADMGSLKRGAEYSYYATGSCTENCLTKNQAQKLCGEIYSYNQNMFNLLTNGGALSERDSTVLQNTSPSFNVSWNGASCRGRMSASGIYKGTSARVDIDGAISGFYIKENGQVLANYLDPLR